MTRPVNASRLTGPPGRPGKDGIDGKPGEDGIDGLPGPVGPVGPSAVVDPFDYGAVGDGITDDTAALQAALDTGRTVMLRGEATYLTAGVFMQPDQLLLGSGATLLRVPEVEVRLSPKGAPSLNIEYTGNVPVMDAAAVHPGDVVMFESAGGDVLAAPFQVVKTTDTGIVVEPQPEFVVPATSDDDEAPVVLPVEMQKVRYAETITPARAVVITPLISMSPGSRVMDLTVDGNRAEQTWVGPGVGEVAAASSSTLDRLTFRNTAGVAVVVTGTDRATLNGCTFTGCWQAITGNTVTRLTVSGGAITASDRGISITSAADPLVSQSARATIIGVRFADLPILSLSVDDCDDLTVESCTLENSMALRLLGPTGRNVNRPRIAGCRLTTTSLQLTRVTDAEVRETSLNGLTAAFVASGLSFDVNACTRVTVDGCRVDGRGQAGYGIRFRSTPGVVVRDCEFTGSVAEGIFTDSACPAPAAERNRIGGCNGLGIRLDTTVGPISAIDNIVTGCGFEGIAAGGGGRVIGNTCDGNNRRGLNAGLYSAGIRLVGGSWIIAGNVCTDTQTTKTQQWGVQLNGTATRVRMVGNLLDGNAAASFNPGNATQITTDVSRRVTATVGTTQVAVAHGLGYMPRIVQITPTSAGDVWVSAPADATNVFLTADAAGRTADVWVG